MEQVTAEDIGSRMRLDFVGEDLVQVDLLIGDAAELVADEFAREGRDLDREVSTTPWLGNAVRRAVRQMVSAAITVGANAGQRSATSSTGDESDAVTWADSALSAVTFGGVRLTDVQRDELGLSMSARPRGRFPRPGKWPEVSAWRR